MTDREYIDLKQSILFLEKQIKIKDEQLQVKNNQINGLLQNNSNMSKALNSPMNEIAKRIYNLLGSILSTYFLFCRK